MAIYMKWNDNSIQGNVTAKGHEKWIEVNSLQFGVGRGIGSPVGRNADREASAPSVSEITVSKSNDATSPLIFQEAVKGEGKDMEFDFVRTSGTQLETFLKIKIYNALVSGYSVSSGGDRPTESISLNFTKIETTYTASDAKQANGSPLTVSYDLATATAA